MKLDSKKQVVEELHGKFENATIVVATEYKGLDVEALSALRKALRDQGAEFQVAKNSLLARASEDTGVALIKDTFKGPTAIAYTDSDPVGAAKALMDFAKTHDKLVVRNAVMQGKELSAADVTALSKLPSREVLLGQVLGTMNAVPTSFVRVLAGVPVNFLNVLNAIKDQKAA